MFYFSQKFDFYYRTVRNDRSITYGKYTRALAGVQIVNLEARRSMNEMIEGLDIGIVDNSLKYKPHSSGPREAGVGMQ